MARFEVETNAELEALIDRLEAGDEVVVARKGKPAVRLMIEPAAPGMAEPEQRAFEVDDQISEALTRDDAAVARLLPSAELRPSRAAATDEERLAQIKAIARAASQEARPWPMPDVSELLEAVSHAAATKAATPVWTNATREQFYAEIRAIQDLAAKTLTSGPDAAHSQDFLYDEHGLPG